MLVLVVTVILIYLIISSSFLRRNKYPKGPFPYPIVGNLPQFIVEIRRTGGVVEALKKFQEKYGDVFTVWLGPIPTVYVGSYELSHESMIRKAHQFSERYTPGIMNEIREGRGIVGSNGEFWLEHRRFALRTFRNFGLGRNIMEERILEELEYRLEELEDVNKNGRVAINSTRFFDFLVGSVINKMLTSERFSKDREAEFNMIKVALEESLRTAGLFDLFVPMWIQKSFLFKWRYDKVMKPLWIIYDFADKEVEKRFAAVEAGEHIVDDALDFIDATILKIRADEEQGIPSTFNKETLKIDVYDLWLAGQETTSVTLSWAVNCLVAHPEVQEKCREEVKSITGGRHLSLADRQKTPYLNATIAEVQRMASILNLNLTRITTEDTTIAGQPCAAGAVIAAEPSLIHIDETKFKDHQKFNPSRFIDDDKLAQQLIPFGIGKRACMGESLARAELYLILGNILQKYQLEAIGKVPELKTNSPLGIMKRPNSCEIIFNLVK